MIPFPERVHQLVDNTGGIKATKLCAQLSCEYLSLTSNQIRSSVITMIRVGELVEIEYILPNYKNESLLLPRGTVVTGVSNEHKMPKM